MFDLEISAPSESIDRAAEFNARLEHATPQQVIRAALDQFSGRIAILSSFGSESAVLLHMVAGIDRHVPVLFLDTGMLFLETLAYRDELAERLGLTDIRVFEPEPADIRAQDPDGMLWSENPGACCGLRKVVPLERALSGFHASFNGRKRFHGESRALIEVAEADGPRVKVNPLANMAFDDLKTYFERNDLPRHPLQSLGFSSIGCMPCTSRTRAGEGVRAGRWRGTGKTECGIHLAK